MVDQNLATRTAALVLAGGTGRRAGGADKGLLIHGNSALIDVVARRLRPQVSRLVISCNRNREAYESRADAVVTDLRGGCPGPLAGIEAGLRVIDTELVLLCPCDTPAVPVDLGHTLYRALSRTPGAAAAYVSCGGRDHWLCALLRRSRIRSPGYSLDAGERRVHVWLREQGAVAAGQDYPASAFHNFNSAPGNPGAR